VLNTPLFEAEKQYSTHRKYVITGNERMAKGKNVLTTGDVAKICNVAPRTVSKWFDSGQLKGYRIPGSKDRRIPLSELIRFMKMHNMPATGLPVGKTRVLVVDSDEDTGSALADALRIKADYEVQIARSNFETGVISQKFAPHVLLVSLLAKGIDATDICESIRSDEDLQTIKIIALANQLSESESAALMQKGFDGCISYPADVAEVVEEIEETTAIVC
jgi:excisionase family DNA binding protein